MPTLASVTPIVPPQMSRIAVGFMNAAGDVPSIIALMRIAPAATAIPIAVAAFMVLSSAVAGELGAPGGGLGQC